MMEASEEPSTLREIENLTSRDVCNCAKEGDAMALRCIETCMEPLGCLLYTSILEHHMHSEFYMVEEDQAKLINETKKNGGRIIAVGTTSCRTLESATGEDGILKAGSGWTEIFIYPGYQFKLIDCLITNFHLPESTLCLVYTSQD